MSDTINLDELLNKSEPVIEETADTNDVESTDNADYSAQVEGDDISVENFDSQNDADTIDENAGNDETDDEVFVRTDGSNEEVTDSGITITDQLEESQSEPTDYKFKDDFIKKAVDYYEKYGTLQPFLEATKTDYESVSDLDVLRMKFDNENSGLSSKAKDRLFQKELEKYNLDSYEEEDVEVGQELLKRDADKLRQTLKEEQKQFLESIQPENQVPQISQAEIEAQRNESRKVAAAGIEGVLKNNFLKVEANGEGINFQIADTNKVVDYALDSSKFLSTFAKDGQVDWDKWTKVVAFAENPSLFISELIKHGKSLGRKTIEAELKNVTPNMKSKTIVEQGSQSDNPYDDKLGFLQGMKVTRK
jgi:hypothetical protein